MSRKWMSVLTYPQHVHYRPASLLDTIESLIPFPEGDRYVAMASWLDDARKAGIITGAEFFTLRNAVAENM